MLRLTVGGKINWTLDIIGIREDGYHLMDMLMAGVELSDVLEMEEASGLSLIVGEEMPKPSNGENAFSSAPVPIDESNLVLKAARALQKATGCNRGASMRLCKRIPVGGGMGGGSADAAAALVGLCRLWELKLSESELKKIALSLGADVPFLLSGGLARIGGIGEKIQPLPFPGACPLVWVQPCDGLSTPEIFRAFDGMEEAEILRPHTQAAQEALLSGNLPALAKAMGNAMEAVSVGKRREIKEAALVLESLGALRGMMTGSGSVVYGIFETEKAAHRAAESLRVRWPKTGFTRTAEKSITVEEC